MKVITTSMNIIAFWFLYIIWIGMSFDIFTPDKVLLKEMMIITISVSIINFIFISSAEIDDISKTTYGKLCTGIILIMWILLISGHLIYWKYYLIYSGMVIFITLSKLYIDGYFKYFIKKNK